jgi:hypothetical protein
MQNTRGQGGESPSFSPKAQSILASVEDPKLAEPLHSSTARILTALEELRLLRLPQDQPGVDFNLNNPPLSDINASVLACIQCIKEVAKVTGEHFPCTDENSLCIDDLDSTFDLVDTGDGFSPLVAEVEESQTPQTMEIRLGKSALAYERVVKQRLLEFGQNLEVACRSEEAWEVLKEVGTFKSRLEKTLLGLLFALLAEFSEDASREEIYPHYRSPTRQSVSLRQEIQNLARDVGQLNLSLSQAHLVVPVATGLSKRLQDFFSHPTYRSIGPDDKHSFILFWKGFSSTQTPQDENAISILRQEIDRLASFLQGLFVFNDGYILINHDKKILNQATAQLEYAIQVMNQDPAHALGKLQFTIDTLTDVMGRHEALDKVLLAWGQRTISEQSLANDLHSIYELSQAALDSLTPA